MNQQQIEKLRKKFILLSTFAFFLIMLFMGGVMYLTNQLVLHSQIYRSLSIIEENGGDLSHMDSRPDSHGGYNLPDSHASSFFEAFGLSGVAELFSYFRKSQRYFSILYSKNGEVEAFHSNLLDFTDADYPYRIAERVLRRTEHRLLPIRKNFGKYDSFYYLISDRENGGTMVIMIDCSTEINTSSRLLYTALILVVIGTMIVLLVVRILSYHVVQPEIRNAMLQKQFITNASHELKTPLSVIRANTELDQMINGDNEWNQSTLRQVDRMNGLIANLVMISKAAEHDDTSERSELDVSRILRETADTFQPVAQQEEKVFETQIPDNIRYTALESDLRQLVSLLIDNAIKYCDEQGRIVVTASSAARSRQLRLSVSNTYAEGATVDYSRFFDRFYRQDKSHNVDRGGYGIGLSIVESIVEKYNGMANVSWKDGMIRFDILLK